MIWYIVGPGSNAAWLFQQGKTVPLKTATVVSVYRFSVSLKKIRSVHGNRLKSKRDGRRSFSVLSEISDTGENALKSVRTERESGIAPLLQESIASVSPVTG